MMISDIAYDLFTGFNALRLVCYLQQIYKIARNSTGVRAISYPTWTLWTAANSSTAIYSFTHPGGITLAWIYGLNALCCTIVIALTAFRQRQYHARLGRSHRDIQMHLITLRPANDMVRPERMSLCR
jgi:hypothetical protein